VFEEKAVSISSDVSGGNLRLNTPLGVSDMEIESMQGPDIGGDEPFLDARLGSASCSMLTHTTKLDLVI
jgi:hypothetical protein